MKQETIVSFSKELASSAAVPGGGGASAYVAALGMALGTMVANLTTGKKKYVQYQEEIEQLIEQTQQVTDDLIACIAKDAESFEPLSKAYGLPRETPEQMKERDAIMEHALVAASEAPIYLMEQIVKSMTLLERLSEIGSRIAISDVGVGVQFAKAALNGASLNVFINTKMMKNRDKAEEMNTKTDALLIDGNELADKIYDTVVDAIR